MKRKIWKILALVLAAALLCGVGWFANAFLGNPVSKALAARTAEKHLAEQYAGTDYYIESVNYSFKTVAYYACVRSPSSGDTQFTLYLDMLGRLYHDTYESVLGGSITARRVDAEYRAFTDRVFESPDFPCPADMAYGTLEIWPREALEDPLAASELPEYALFYDELVLDRIYDPGELGARAGHLVVYVDSDILTAEKMAEVLLTIREAFDRAGVTFRAIDLTLQGPAPEEERWNRESVGVKDFDYSDIIAEGITEKAGEAMAALEAYYAEMDARK